ncbi:MAG: FHA domain-containing protein [Deltaproteobacteria bacterium]|nr:FHA domain-containing protein [Deltaproteobacteria bacterium]MBW2374746.1 FHA domain-containing protein [Deltaproteobacteria bacterium]
MRYRLRFHLQEVDLAGDEVVVGRGSMGHVTIDDPMLSRRHIRFDLSGSEPTLEDLHSRNGTQLNERPLVGRATLKDGDRIRIGTQELVFLVPNAAKKNHRTTCGLTFCTACAVPYPSTSAQCPHCGAIPTEQGVSTSVRDVAASGWTFHLLSQVVDRAIDQGRLADAERMMSRGVSELEEQLEEGVEVEPSRILAVAECAARLGCALRSGRWLEIGARLYGRAGAPPSREVLALVDELPADARIADAMSALRHAGPPTRQAG